MPCTVYYGEGCRQELATKEAPQDEMRRVRFTEILLSSLMCEPKFPEKALSLLKVLQVGSDYGEMECYLELSLISLIAIHYKLMCHTYHVCDYYVKVLICQTLIFHRLRPKNFTRQHGELVEETPPCWCSYCHRCDQYFQQYFGKYNCLCLPFV